MSHYNDFPLLWTPDENQSFFLVKVPIGKKIQRRADYLLLMELRLEWMLEREQSDEIKTLLLQTLYRLNPTRDLPLFNQSFSADEILMAFARVVCSLVLLAFGVVGCQRAEPVTQLGDATKTVPHYLKAHPETVVALAYFDFDLYEPTKFCLEAILPYCTKGTVLAFDELLSRHFPGETVALRETLTLSKYKIYRSKYATIQTYLVLE